ncbi:MAG TPA: hypothetical protein VHS09_04975 [Polyangiaceae bacterium]|nr:hypothetical protein [Polyangiaceae bacterium]
MTVALGLSLDAAARAEDEVDEGVPFKSVDVQGNPLGLIIGRYSADLEYLPAPHHALHFSPVGYFALPGVADELVGFGAEMGYRWYSGLYGPHGFFLGASFVALSLHYLHGALPGVPLDASEDTSYVELGGALDAGYQVVILGNLALGIGVGAQYTADTTTPTFEYQSHPWHDLLYGSGLRPRVLLSVGAAF